MLGLITLTFITILLAIEVVILKGLRALKLKTSFSRPTKVVGAVRQAPKSICTRSG
jgi:hypothetical protein